MNAPFDTGSRREQHKQCEFRFHVTELSRGSFSGTAEIWIGLQKRGELSLLQRDCSVDAVIALMRDRCIAWLEVVETSGGAFKAYGRRPKIKGSMSRATRRID